MRERERERERERFPMRRLIRSFYRPFCLQAGEKKFGGRSPPKLTRTREGSLPSFFAFKKSRVPTSQSLPLRLAPSLSLEHYDIRPSPIP